MKRRRTILGVVLACAFVNWQAVAQMPGYFPNPGYDRSVEDVSIVQLIATPHEYDGKRVRLIGFLRIEFEGNALYLHREDYEKSIDANALWINIPAGMTKQQQQAVNMHYVICVGVFDASHRGHMDLFSGEVKDVARLQVWPGHAASGDKESQITPQH